MGNQLVSRIRETVPTNLPETEAIYLFGSTVVDRPSRFRSEGPSLAEPQDVDIAILLPPVRAKELGSLQYSDLRFRLEDTLDREVDLINLRLATTVFQKEVVATGEPILVTDRAALEEFEMLTLSFYQKLNEERRGILEEVLRSGRAYRV